ncbi:hypothetical protein GF337_16555 [candidate division KSB1 bacterium]|nr:hypothetical protein [candidate division KSB1 bacterium]
MSLKLKVDLHIHTAEDVAEIVGGRTDLLPARRFIDLAVKMGYDAISFTHHGVLYNDPRVFKYAADRGLILIPGVETFINRKHVLLLNCTARKHILTYHDLRRYKDENVLVIAPHPYYLVGMCLGRDLKKNIDMYDAIEYCHYYYKLFNPNRKALRVARKHKKPVVGNSDAHYRDQFGTTYSYVYAEEKSIPAIIRAIKAGKVEYVSHPRTFQQFVDETRWILEKLPYEIQMKMRSQLKRSSSKFFKKVRHLLAQNGLKK